MRGLCDALHCEPPPSRWSPGGVFLDDLVERYIVLAGRMRRHRETGQMAAEQMTAEQHAQWFTSLAVENLPLSSACRIFTDLHLWEQNPDEIGNLVRSALADRIHAATVSFVHTVKTKTCDLDPCHHTVEPPHNKSCRCVPIGPSGSELKERKQWL